MADNQDQAPKEETPWWAAFPLPKAQCDSIEPEEVLKLLEAQDSQTASSNRDFLLVDVRRTDWEGGTISSSINLPAQTLYQTRPVIYQLVKQAGIRRVIFYCGSSNGRGPRSAAWLQDYFDEVGDKTVEALILKGGIKGWVRNYGGKMMDAFDADAWAGKGI